MRCAMQTHWRAPPSSCAIRERIETATSGRELYDFVKSAEFRNAIGDKDFDKAVGSMVSADVATGGIVTPRTFLQMSQMLKGALPGLSDDYLYKIMPELSQEFGGARAGTAATSLYQQLIAGQMRTTGIKLLDDLGMVDESKADFDKNGRIVRMRPGAYKDSDTFKSDPLKGMADLIAAMKAHGITTEGAQRDELTMMFGNRNAAQMAMTLGYQFPRLQRGAQGIENTWPLGSSSDELLKNNPYDQWSKFTSSLTNLGAELGTDLMPAAIDAAHGLTTIAQSLASVFKAFPLLGALAQSGFSLGGKAADAAADIGKHTSIGALWNWITGSGAFAADSDKTWADFQKQFKPGDLNNLPDLGPVPDKASQQWFGDKNSWFRKMSYDGGGRSGGAAMAQVVNMVAGVVNLANAGGAGGAGGAGAGGIMKAAYTEGGALGGAGGLHSGGGYTVRGGDGGGLRSGGGAPSYANGGSDAPLTGGFQPHKDFRGFVSATDFYGALVRKGFTPMAARGLLGSGMFESGGGGRGGVYLDPPTDAFHKDWGTGDAAVGAMQFEGKRRYGFDPTLQSTIDHIWNELHGSEAGIFGRLQGAGSPAEAADLVNYGYERPQYPGKSRTDRQRYAAGRLMASAANSVAAVPDATTPVSEAYAGSDFGHRSHDTIQVTSHVKIGEKTIATAVQRHIVNANRQVMGASKHDLHGHMQLVDQGYQWDR